MSIHGSHELMDLESSAKPTPPECIPCPPESTPPPPNPLNHVRSIILASAAGIVWGITFEKSRVFEIRAIRGQMVFERFVMLKMFMAAMGISAFCIATVGAFKPELVYRTIRTKFRVGCNRGVLRGTVLGAFILGCGMSLSSACPGMVLAQVGAGQPNSMYTVLGGLFGCFLYGSFETSVWGKAVRREAGARSEAERSEEGEDAPGSKGSSTEVASGSRPGWRGRERSSSSSWASEREGGPVQEAPVCGGIGSQDRGWRRRERSSSSSWAGAKRARR